jgi:phage terminase large subunit
VWKWNGALVLDEIFYRTGMLNRDIAQEYRNAGIRPHDEIFADSAEPKSIDELHSQGFNVKPVTKGPDSIKYGIDVMKQYDLYVTARSHNLRKEFKKYSWAKDKNGNSLNVPAG